MRTFLTFVLLPLIALTFLLAEPADAQVSSGGTSTSSSASPQSSGSATNAPTTNPTPDSTPTPTPTPSNLSLADVEPLFELYGNRQDANAVCIVMYPAKDGCSMRSFPGYIKWDGSQGMISVCSTPVELLPPDWYLGFSGCGSELGGLSPDAYSQYYPVSNDNVFADRASSDSLVLGNRATRTSQKVGLRKILEFFQNLFSSPAARQTMGDAAQNAGTSPAVRQQIAGDQQAARTIREGAEDAASNPNVRNPADGESGTDILGRKAVDTAIPGLIDAIDRYNDAVLDDVIKMYGHDDVLDFLLDPDQLHTTKKMSLRTEDGVVEQYFDIIVFYNIDDWNKNRAFIIRPTRTPIPGHGGGPSPDLEDLM